MFLPHFITTAPTEFYIVELILVKNFRNLFKVHNFSWCQPFDVANISHRKSGELQIIDINVIAIVVGIQSDLLCWHLIFSHSKLSAKVSTTRIYSQMKASKVTV